MYSNDNIEFYTKKQLKKIAKRSLAYCMIKFGTNNRKRNPLSLKIVEGYCDGFFGMYYPEINTIEIYPEACGTIGRFTSTIIHEYTHTLQKQDVRVYSKLLKLHGYWDHPHEVEARQNEKKFNRELLRCLREMW